MPAYRGFFRRSRGRADAAVVPMIIVIIVIVFVNAVTAGE